MIDPGSSAYSTLTNLPNGRLGLLYERDNYTKMTYASFGKRWVNGACGEISGAASGQTVTDATTSIPVTVTNTGQGPLEPGVLQLKVPTGWRARSVRLPRLRPRWSLTVTVPVSLDKNATTGTFSLPAVYTNHQGQSQSSVTLTALAGPPTWSTNGPITTDGAHAVDETAHLDAVKNLPGGTIAVQFSTTQTAPAATLLSAADTTSNVEDLVVSLNSGKPYVEIRTGTNTYPVRLASSVTANDGKAHLLTVTSNSTGTTLALDGAPVGHTSTQAFFGTITGLTNLTLGANVASLGTRWQFNGTINSVTVYKN